MSSKPAIRRIYVPPQRFRADTNIRYQHEIHKGTWITHPEASSLGNHFHRYKLEFHLEAEATIRFHVSADQRFELTLDGERIGRGPDRGDIDFWSFHTWEACLSAGGHVLEARTHYLEVGAPAAQLSLRPAFLFYAENAPVDLNTGSASWRVARMEGISTRPAAIPFYHVIGPRYELDGNLMGPEPEWKPPVTVGPAGHEDVNGIVHPGWMLFPTPLPDPHGKLFRGGKVRHVSPSWKTHPITESPPGTCLDWQDWLDGRRALAIGPDSKATIIIDLEDYLCAYPEIRLSGGEHAFIELEWAEALYTSLERHGNQPPPKGNRNQIDNKLFLGFGDTFISNGWDDQAYQPPWWRAGRYLRLTVRTVDEALTLEALNLHETRFPLKNSSAIECDDPALMDYFPLAVRGMQSCAHETYVDCPYYEQLMYVGDTRLHMLTSYVMDIEDRLNQRTIDLFDHSRTINGFVLERHPSMPRQVSCTYAMIWILMIRDHAWWRDEPAFIRKHIKGMRCLLEEFRALEGDAGLIHQLPGWSFMDWVPEWTRGIPPAPKDEPCGCLNLLYLIALEAAQEVEQSLGEPAFAHIYKGRADTLARGIEHHFWNADRDLFAEESPHAHFSEHAQCLALLSPRFAHLHAANAASLVAAPDLARTTIYFSFYLFEALYWMRQDKRFFDKLDLFKSLPGQGFKTPAEEPEPSRSDCHAWGSHPLFHFHASMAGVRPAAPGFREVRIQPLPGSLNRLRSRVPHPLGQVETAWERTGDTFHFQYNLPKDTPARLVTRDGEISLVGSGEIKEVRLA